MEAPGPDGSAGDNWNEDPREDHEEHLSVTDRRR
jgi:hypothetical protein